MSNINYSALDAHSRNCDACLRQRQQQADNEDPGVGNRHRHSVKKRGSFKETEGELEAKQMGVKKRNSLANKDQAAARKRLSDSAVGLRRSSSSLSYSDIGGDEHTSYMTPTQRRAQEVRRLKSELARAHEVIQARDREISGLRKELVSLREKAAEGDVGGEEAVVAAGDELEDSASAADSGNCEEEEARSGAVSPHGEVRLDNIDFELMESTLREEEETRHRLEEGNKTLRDEAAGLRRQLSEISERNAALEADLAGKDVERREQAGRLEELAQELAHSTARVARQQDLVEQAHSRMERLQAELDTVSGDHRVPAAGLHRSEPEVGNGSVARSCQETQQRISDENTSVPPPGEFVSGDGGGALPPKDDPLVTPPTEAPVSTGRDRQQEEEGGEPPSGHAEVGCQTLPLLPSPDDQPVCDNGVHYTYEFLKRSVYYFLTDKDNSSYHLKSIQRLLEFSDKEKYVISKSRVK